MLKRVKTFINRHSLISPDESLLLAVSGGPDSMALLHLLWSLQDELGFTLAAVTVDHRLRETSAGEIEMVKSYCNTLGVDHTGLKVPSPPPSGESLEDWARRERYALLNRHANDLDASRIALGHTADDQVETLFIRLIRGTGLRGLGGMKPLARGRFIRPLLEERRREILNYISRHDIPTIVDESNASHRFLRNRIRHHLLPLLRNSFSPSIDRTILRTQRLMAKDDACLSAMARQWLAGNIRDNTLPLKGWRALPSALRVRVLLGFLTAQTDSHLSFTAEHLLHLESALLLRRNVMLPLAPAPLLLVGECDTIQLVPDIPGIEHPVVLTVTGITSIPALHASVRARRGGDVSSSPWVCGVNATTAPLAVITRRGGETIASEEGPRTVKKILKEHNIPRHRRRNIPLVVAGSSVIWIPGVYSPAVHLESDHITLRWEPWKP